MEIGGILDGTILGEILTNIGLSWKNVEQKLEEYWLEIGKILGRSKKTFRQK